MRRFKSPLLVAVALSAAFVACRDDSASRSQSSGTSSSMLEVTIRDDTLLLGDGRSTGWTRVRLQASAESHIPVVFRLAPSVASSDVPAFVAALDSMSATPENAVAIGGPEMGAAGDAIVHLTPGRYVVACVRRGEDGHRHAHRGEFAVLEVHGSSEADSATAAAPESAHLLRLADFAFVGEALWTPGATMLRIENTGRQDHQLRLARLHDSVTLMQWAESEDPSTVSTNVTGMARLGPQQVAYLPVDVQAGTYVAYCLITDPVTKKPHIELGMLREITVKSREAKP